MNAQPFELNEDSLLFINKLGMYYENYGIPRIGGRILGLMLISGQPLSAEKIANLLKVSRGSVSTNVRLLASNELLERISVMGEKVDYYTVSELIWERAIQMRIDGFKTLKRIVELGLRTANVDSSTPPNRSLPEMLQWVDTMTASHEQALIQWKQTKPPLDRS